MTAMEGLPAASVDVMVRPSSRLRVFPGFLLEGYVAIRPYRVVETASLSQLEKHARKAGR